MQCLCLPTFGKPVLFQHCPGGGVVPVGASDDGFHARLRFGPLNHAAHRFGHKALFPACFVGAVPDLDLARRVRLADKTRVADHAVFCFQNNGPKRNTQIIFVRVGYIGQDGFLQRLFKFGRNAPQDGVEAEFCFERAYRRGSIGGAVSGSGGLV